MSWILQREITKITRDFLKPTEKEILKAYANYAKDDGTKTYPSLRKLMKDTSRCRLTIQTTVKSLVEKTFLILVKAATPRSTPEYQINVDLINNINKGQNNCTIENDVLSSNSGVKKLYLRGKEIIPQGYSSYTLTLIESLREPLEKRNTSYFQKNNLSSNQSDLGNLSPEQKSRSGETDLLGSEEINLDKTPTPNSEQSKQEGKSVEPPLPTLKAEDVETSKKSKGKGKVSNPKVQATQINPEMELTPELREIALDVRFDGKGLKEGVIESVFEDFVDHYVANRVSRPRWDLSWKNWCKKAIEIDKFGTKSMVNPPRTTVSDKPAEVKLEEMAPEFEGFAAKYPTWGGYLRGATLVDSGIPKKLVIIQPKSFPRSELSKPDAESVLKEFFGKQYIDIVENISSVRFAAGFKPEQIAINPGPSGKLDQALTNMAHGANRKKIKENAGISLVVDNPEKSTSVSNPLPKPSYNSVKPMQDSEVGEKQIWKW